jgi:hypothetical protein
LGYVTWAGPVTGEPVRALLTRRSASVVAGVAAGAAERGLYNLSAFVLIVTAFMLIAAETHGLAVAMILAALLVAIAGLATYIRRRERRGSDRGDQQSPAAALPDPLHPAPGPLRQALKTLWRDRRGALPLIGVLCLAQHALLIYEAYLLLGVLGGGTTLRTALVFEAVSKIVNTVGAIVPGRVGISEGGSALLADALGFGASHGLSLALMRRVRSLIWTGVGLTLLPVQEARARRGA